MTGSSGTPVSPAVATEAVSDPWRVIADKLVASYRTGSMVVGGKLVARIIEAADAAGHHPDIDLRYGTVYLTLTTHSAHALTEADVALANTIAEIARELELQPVVVTAAQVDIAIDALDIPAIRPFWAAVLGYADAAEHQEIDLVDPDDRLPGVWFQQMDEARPQRNRVHLDLLVPHDAVHERLQDALTAGGQLLTDQYAPGFWVLADAEGNEVCLCTWQGGD